MVISVQSNLIPHVGTVIKCRLENNVLTLEPQPFEADFCFCEFACERAFPAFAGSTKREKDFFTLYFENKDTENGTTEFYGVLNGSDFLLVDGVHGSVINNGFIIDFTKIHNLLGVGKYSFRIDIVEFTRETQRTFKYFDVQPFNQKIADGTVKIEAVQNGEIESQFVYDNVPFSIRLFGKLHDRQEVFETIQNDTYNRQKEDIHTRSYFTYTLEIDSHSVNENSFVNSLLVNYSLANQIKISDYNLARNQFVYNELLVIRTEEAASIENDPKSQYAKYKIGFQDAIQNNIKHPFS